MEIKDVLDVITNNGVCVALLIYYMYRDFKMITELKDTMAVVKEYVRKQEKRLESEDKDND